MRTFVAILTALPLLLPPGMGACDCSRLGTSPVRPLLAQVNGKPSACSHCHCRAKAEHRFTDGLPVASANDRAPGPKSPVHGPGCPALKDHSKVAEQGGPLFNLLVVRTGDLFQLIAMPRTRSSEPFGSTRVAARPIYITFRALLI